MNEAVVAAICAVGPSLPPEPPQPIVIAEAIIFTGMARGRMAVGAWLIERIATSVPCPSVSGAIQTTSPPATRAPAIASTGIAHGCANPLAGWNPPASAAMAAGWYPTPPRNQRVHAVTLA